MQLSNFSIDKLVISAKATHFLSHPKDFQNLKILVEYTFLPKIKLKLRWKIGESTLIDNIFLTNDQKNRNVCQKSKFIWKIKVDVKNRNFCQKSKFLSKIKNFVKNLNNSQKSKLFFCQKSDNQLFQLTNWLFPQKWHFWQIKKIFSWEPNKFPLDRARRG